MTPEHPQKEKLRKRLLKLIFNLEQDLSRFSSILVEEFQAELLKHSLHLAKRGLARIVLHDYERDREVCVDLDIHLSPQENLSRRFTQIKKAKRGLPLVTARLSKIKEELAMLDAPEVHATLEEPAPLPTHKVPPKKKAPDPFRSIYHIFQSKDERPIWVGKSGKDNLLLTFRSARGNDWWFHVRDRAGSHVIVPNKSIELSSDVVLDAATLAIHFSKANGEPSAEVIYTQVKNLKRLPKAEAGKVSVQKEKVLFLKVEAARLARLLATKCSHKSE